MLLQHTHTHRLAIVYSFHRLAALATFIYAFCFLYRMCLANRSIERIKLKEILPYFCCCWFLSNCRCAKTIEQTHPNITKNMKETLTHMPYGHRYMQFELLNACCCFMSFFIIIKSKHVFFFT